MTEFLIMVVSTVIAHTLSSWVLDVAFVIIFLLGFFIGKEYGEASYRSKLARTRQAQRVYDEESKRDKQRKDKTPH